MKLIQDLSFSGSIHENPLDHVRDYDCMIETPSEIEESLDAQKKGIFPAILLLGSTGSTLLFTMCHLIEDKDSQSRAR
jgi:hypothetical protein